MIIAATGHRPNKLNNEWDGIGPCSDYLRKQTRKVFLERKPDEVITGMALGYDMLFAEVAIEMNINVLTAIPFIGQEKIWPTKSQNRYNNILDNKLVKQHVVFQGGFESWKLLDKNKFMVDRCNLVLACYNGDLTGGTAHCVNYARNNGKEIVIVNPNEYILD